MSYWTCLNKGLLEGPPRTHWTAWGLASQKLQMNGGTELWLTWRLMKKSPKGVVQGMGWMPVSTTMRSLLLPGSPSRLFIQLRARCLSAAQHQPRHFRHSYKQLLIKSVPMLVRHMRKFMRMLVYSSTPAIYSGFLTASEQAHANPCTVRRADLAKSLLALLQASDQVHTSACLQLIPKLFRCSVAKSLPMSQADCKG